jgi:hypothetical protein
MRVLVFVGALIGALCLLASFFMAGAPQQAAMAGMACAFAIIPYVLFRVGATADEESQRKQIIELLKQRQQ